MSSTWPYTSLTQAPTNLKEAIDWVLRVTGKDGKKNAAATQSQPAPASPPQFSCLCFLAKAVKDLLYDARDPGSPGPSLERYWDDILLTEEQDIVKSVLTDLGLVSSDSTSAASTGSATCAGGTEVIGTLIDQLALGLQKWVGWQDKDECCLKGETGIGGKCDCAGGSAGCCNGSSGTCNCATQKNCYKSAYDKEKALWTTVVNGTTDAGGSGSAGSAVGGKGATVDTVKAAQEVHLLARIFLGSVCLIWSGLSQLGFLTKEGSGGTEQRWSKGELSKEATNLGSFMAAMGYDLDRLNGSGGTEKKGTDVWKLLSGKEPDKNGIKWQEFKNGPPQDSVAEYYSAIYEKAEKAGNSTTESICKDYPLLVLHILASGYFRAGSAGAKNITPKAPSNDPRKPRTIREILYWLSALPYSQGYCGLVGRMGGKYPPKENNPKELEDKIELYNESKASTILQRKDITHYLTAACGYCPLVLIGIQGTINTSGTDSAPAAQGPAGAGAADDKRCPKHKDNRHKRCDPKNIKEEQVPQQPAAPSTGKPLQAGQVCYGGYHLEVSKFGPLHGMYANGLFGFDMGGSPAQCLDQLRVYVYHCFYQLYFLRKQCGAGVESGAVLGWQSCRYGSGLSGAGAENWICETTGGSDGKCNCYSGKKSPLMLFLCDTVTGLHCRETIGKGVDAYPAIETHWTTKDDNPPGHFGTPQLNFPKLCPVPMGWQAEPSSTSGTQKKENHFKDLNNGSHKQESLQTTGSGGTNTTYPAHCTGNTLSLLLEYYCDPEKCHGTLVVLLRLLACITPTVPRTLGDLFGFYYYIVYIGGSSNGNKAVSGALRKQLQDVRLGMDSRSDMYSVVGTLATWNGSGSGCTSGCKDTLRCLYSDSSVKNCNKYLSPLSGQQYGQLSPAMAGTYLSWLVYLIGEFHEGLKGLKEEFKKVDCKGDGCGTGAGGAAAAGCGGTGQCTRGNHGMPCTSGASQGVCGCASVVSCTGVLPVLYKYGFGYGDVSTLHKTGSGTQNKRCEDFLSTLESVLKGEHLKTGIGASGLHHEINQLIYTTRLPWIFVLTLAWLVALLYLAFGAIWPLDWTHMRSHCRGWFRKGSLSPWEILMVGKKKGKGILEFFGRK